VLGRKDYTREELDHAKAAIAAQVAGYKNVVKATRATKHKKVDAALAVFEPRFFNGLVLELDRWFVHRIRPVAGKDGNPLNEVEMLAESLMNNDGVLQKSTALKLIPAESVTKLEFGDPIELTEPQFEQLAAAFFAELERKFVAPG
jgi:hypothetical protein